jgi:predicted transglutaminase-like cysteine proteinase
MQRVRHCPAVGWKTRVELANTVRFHNPMPRLRPRLSHLPVAALGCLLLAAALAQGADEGRLDEVQLQASASRAGERARSTLRHLLPVLRSARLLAPAAQLQVVNQFLNSQIEFATDPQVWGQVDYWASPLETLNKGAGDCEDYAIAKYFALLAIGMPAARLRLVYVRAQLDDGPAQPHMVLAYYPSDAGEVLILDNLVDAIRTAGQRDDLVPVFSFNSQGLWQGVGLVGAGDPAARLSRWRDVMVKARAEGFR